jgi:hypothetical protein
MQKHWCAAVISIDKRTTASKLHGNGGDFIVAIFAGRSSSARGRAIRIPPVVSMNLNLLVGSSRNLETTFPTDILATLGN